MDNIVFGGAPPGYHDDTVPMPAETLFPQGSPAGASPRPEIVDSSMGQAPQQGDADFYTNCAAPKPSTPDIYAGVLDRNTFRG
jgi:hypothetical protein